MVGAEVFRDQAVHSNGAVEHPTECNTIDGSSLDAESNDAARVLIHRLAPGQIDIPETVLQVSNGSQPGRTASVRPFSRASSFQ